jgi:GxxExxY protein
MKQIEFQEKILHKELSYGIIGACMKVHGILFKGFNEVVYKDAVEIELRSSGIAFAREKPYKIIYDGVILKHHYIADFVIEDSVILEVKALEALGDSHVKQTLNYLSISKLRLGLLVNFGEDKLKYKRIVL